MNEHGPFVVFVFWRDALRDYGLDRVQTFEW